MDLRRQEYFKRNLGCRETASCGIIRTESGISLGFAPGNVISYNSEQSCRRLLIGT